MSFSNNLVKVFGDICAMDPTGHCAKDKDVESFIGGIGNNILSSVFIVIGIICVVVIIIGGISIMTSAGDANKVAKGKRTILGAVIGLIISVCAFAIVNSLVNALG